MVQVYKVAKIGEVLNVKKAGQFSNYRRACSIIKAQADIAQEKGANIVKIGSQYFMKAQNYIMMIFIGSHDCIDTSKIRRLYEEGAAQLNKN